MRLKHSSVLSSKRANCFLIALKNACSWLDEQHIIDVGLSNGIYNPKSGTTTGLVTKYMDLLGVQYTLVYDRIFGSRQGLTIHRFAKAFPKGVYIILVDGHGLLLNNGSIIDPNMGNYGIQRKVNAAYLIKNSDLEPEDRSWNRKTKFKVVIRKSGSGTGFRKGSSNHIHFECLASDQEFKKNGFSFEEAKAKYGTRMETFAYFIERGIIRKEA